MKRKDEILLFGIGSIILLISVQIFLIRGIWKQKNEMFDLRYKTLSQEAVTQFNEFKNTEGFDTALFVINKFAEEFMDKDVFTIKNEQDLLTEKKKALDYVTGVLYLEQDLSENLSGYFEKQGFEKEFNSQIIINYLEFINLETKVTIFISPEYAKLEQDKSAGIQQSVPKTISRILVKRFSLEDNYYRLSFDYYIDFADKKSIVLKETFASLGMSSFSIIVVVIIFMITYRNLMEEKRLSNLKTDFINNMTHELKTPLSTITIAGKTLEMEQIRSNDSKVLETAKLIGKQSIHLNQLINLILEISMWERTQFQLDKKNVRVNEVMHDIVEGFRAGCGDYATISQNYNLDGIKANLDIVYFTTMINNLLSNAVKYSKAKPEISVEGYLDNGMIHIKVIDNGVGISKLDQKHIFEKFYRVSYGNIHKIKGLGLGLYYVKKIAEAHGGNVTVNSKIGKGSIFTVTIPY